MECTESISKSDAANKAAIFSRNSKITEFFELCIQPKTIKEMESILLRFWEIFDSFPRSLMYIFCDIDVAIIFALDYTYKNNDISLCSMTRSLFAYHNQFRPRFIRNTSLTRSVFPNFLKDLREISNIYTDTKCQRVVLNVSVDSISDANFGLAHFLIKFGLMEFPAEDEVKAREMISQLLSGFNNDMFFTPNMRTDVECDELIYRMRQNDIKFTRALLVFCAVTIAASYLQSETDGNVPSFIESRKEKCIRKFQCLELVVSSTSETKLIYREIENFIATILSPLVETTVCNRLIETSRNFFNDVTEFYNPRSLKDLGRCKIRACLQKQRMFPEQVNQLMIPDALKEYLLLQRDGILDLLKERFNFEN